MAGKELEFAQRHMPLRELVLPAPGTADLWLLDLLRLGSPLQPGEPMPAQGLTVRQQRAMRRFYLRLLLGSYLGLPGKDVHISRVIKGKPVLDPAQHESTLQFSMAASDGYCLIGVTSSAAIGVDLETRERQAGNPLGLARRYFSREEYAELAALPPTELPAAFLHSWACKEAMVKAAGHGIANRLARFTVNVRPGEPAAVLSMEEDDASAWQLRSFVAGQALMGAVTVRYPELKLRGFALLPVA